MARSQVDRAVVEGWLRDIGCTPVPRTDPQLLWALEVSYPPQLPSKLTIYNSKSMPRAVVIASRTLVAPEHVEAFNNLDDDSKHEFWEGLAMRLTRHDFVEFHLEGTPPKDCPAAFNINVARFDDGLTLDSFARSLSSVNKAYLDGCNFFREQFGTRRPMSGGEFEFKRTTVQ